MNEAQINAPSPLAGEGMVASLRMMLGEGSPQHESVPWGDPLYLHQIESVRWKRLSALAGGHRPKRVAMSPVTPPASTVGELWDRRHVTYDRTVAGSRSHEQGRLP